MDKIDIKKMTIKEIKAFPDTGDAFISLLKQDNRAGVRAYAKQLENKNRKQKELINKILEKKEIEESLYDLGFQLICGMDEVGRGPLAGPVVTAAVILPKDSFIIGIDDSKKVKKTKREELAEQIKKEAICYAYGSISPEHIDQMNILNATKKAMISAVSRLRPQPEILLIDALKLGTQIEELSIIKGDEKSYSIGAASILAKVKRDNYMLKMDQVYPEYDFKHNVGYGTKKHLEAIRTYGLTPIHRRTFCTKFD